MARNAFIFVRLVGRQLRNVVALNEIADFLRFDTEIDKLFAFRSSLLLSYILKFRVRKRGMVIKIVWWFIFYDVFFYWNYATTI